MKIIKPDVFVDFEGRTGDDILRKSKNVAGSAIDQSRPATPAILYGG